MLFEIKSYLKFILRSTNAHGIHSPFVFDLVSKCFYDKKFYPEYKNLDIHRESLFYNKNEINVTDFGSGSKVFKSNVRKVGDIARNAGINKKRARLLFRIARYFEAKDVLEIGTSVGLATSALALANKNGRITSLEGCPETVRMAAACISKLANNVSFVEAEFMSYLQTIGDDQKYDLIYFDGNHNEKSTLAYFETLLPTVHNDSIWIFDDIHWSPEMQNAWHIIKERPEVTVTIDTFQWGIVFFRSDQQKEHFVVRV